MAGCSFAPVVTYRETIKKYPAQKFNNSLALIFFLFCIFLGLLAFSYRVTTLLLSQTLTCCLPAGLSILLGLILASQSVVRRLSLVSSHSGQFN